jgi:hypothetical protein
VRLDPGGSAGDDGTDRRRCPLIGATRSDDLAMQQAVPGARCTWHRVPQLDWLTDELDSGVVVRFEYG